MSGDAVETARASFEAFNEGELDRFWALAREDVRIVTDERWPGGGAFRGREQVGRFLEQFLEAFGDVRFVETREPERIDDKALLRGRWHGHGAASGIETESPEFSAVATVKGGLIADLHVFFDEHRAREFAGLD